MTKIKEMFDEAHELTGWLGVLMILSAYALVSFAYMSTSSFVYQVLNLAGGAALAYSSLKVKNYPLTVLNIIWALIGLTLIVKPVVLQA